MRRSNPLLLFCVALAACLLGPCLAVAQKATPLPPAPGAAGAPTPAAIELDAYLARVRQVEGAINTTPGSLWTPDGRLTNMSTDYKAQSVNDIVTIQVMETTQATGSGAVKSARNFNASSSISALFGLVKGSNAMQNLFSPQSSQSLNGQAQTASSSQLQTSLSGRVVDVLPNGYLVIQAVRTIIMDNQQQTLIVRGVVRPTDLSPVNSVMSTQVADLEVELNGKGVISDGTRPPNKVTNFLLRILGF